MKIKVLCIGTLSHKYLGEGVSYYIQKLKHYGRFELVELKVPKNKQTEDAAQVKKNEFVLFGKHINAGDTLILLDDKGQQFDSVAFANYIQVQTNHTPGNLVFCIGGAFGFDDELYKIAKAKISFSKLTFNHQIFRLILFEQLYRACSILKNEPYHHA
ncbi:MAG: 23S rRNA (pseudouridine(1915)-N(3))-methyltransferase RlmH [Bacteroidota bacterium]|nr:23S rRNA (pseudouridine(1915)-N(3))-methyltransferase RlmH [Bacteroidota bacterium]